MRQAIIFLIISILTGCAPAIDKIGGSSTDPIITNPTKDVYLNFYKDYNLFRFESNVTYSKDLEKQYPKHFELKLPKGLKYYEFINSTDFAFYYGGNEIVFIKIDLEDSAQIETDNVQNPDNSEIQKLLDNARTNSNKKYNIKNEQMIKGRRNLIFQYGQAKILLFNIKENAFSDFQESGKSFHFLIKG